MVDLLYKEQMILSDQKFEWENVLKELSNTLIDNNIIKDDYREFLLQEYREEPEYILIRNTVALPHLDPNQVTQDLGISFLLTEKGISYGSQTIHMAILLTTPDKTSHLGALYDIYKIASDERFIYELSKLKKKEKVIQRIGQYTFSKD
ncbi:PTS sugar transporter subunit IIA [Tetragenococcus halophilus]|nr:PTS sugar transporter subunit IIA [Tetragenococcus halophilus]